MTTKSISQQYPEPLIQFTRAKCDLDKPKTRTRKTPEDFQGVFEYSRQDGRFLPSPENVRNFVHKCFGLLAIENRECGCLEFIDPEAGVKYPFSHVRKKTNNYFKYRCHTSVKKSFTQFFECEALSHPYSALYALGVMDKWDGIPRMDKYIDLLEWDPNYQPPVTMKEDGTPRSGQEWKRYALRTWLVNCWLRTTSLVCEGYESPDNLMIILCSDNAGEGKAQWVKGLVGDLAKDSMFVTNYLERNKKFIQHTRIKPICFLDGIDRFIDCWENNEYLSHIIYPEQGAGYVKATSFIGTATDPDPYDLAHKDSRRIILRVRKAEYADQMPPLDVSQFWAEVRHLAEYMEPGEFSFVHLKKNIWEYNKNP